MTKRTKTVGIALTLFLVVVSGGLYFLYQYLTALAPPQVTVTRSCISSNHSFINGISIEQIKVDSIGANQHPVKYTVVYRANCHIDHPQNKPPQPPGKICFREAGKYWWTAAQVNIPFTHEGLGRQMSDTAKQVVQNSDAATMKTCPIDFEQGQWYFITIGNPQVTGIFFYIDKSGNEHQYLLPSGVSPI